VDTFVPLNPEMSIVNVKAALSKILNGKELIGLGACPKVCVSGIWLCFGLGLFF
jgi:hypothetical protein